MSKPENPPAFARPFFIGDGEWSSGQEGMSLRDWFAGQALAVLGHNDMAPGTTKDEMRALARNIYKMADALLEERAKVRP